MYRARVETCLETVPVWKGITIEAGDVHGAIANGGDLCVTDFETRL